MTDYKKQGEDFLTETGTTLEVVETVPQKNPLWCKEGEKHGIQYAVTLKNERYSYTFNFWGSIADSEMLEKAEKAKSVGSKDSPYFFHVLDFIKKDAANIIPKNFKINGHVQSVFIDKLPATVSILIKPNAYDVLACLDVLYSDNFEDFCGDFGYDTDSIQAEKTYRAAQEQDRALRRLFTLEQLEKLQEIQ